MACSCPACVRFREERARAEALAREIETAHTTRVVEVTVGEGRPDELGEAGA